MNNTELPRAISALRKMSKRWQATALAPAPPEDRSPFQVLISCILSLRTKDAVTIDASRRLFSLASTPERLRELPVETIARAIYPVGFYKTKAKTVRDIAERILQDYNGKVPDEIDELLKLKGVGRKTANLVVTIGYNKPGICVDTHVHRISNRWGYIVTKSPEESERELRKVLPRRFWIPYNDLLVSFGQNICKPLSPLCSQCPVRKYCRQVGVARSR